MHASVFTQHNMVMDAYILRRLSQEDAECKVKEELSLLVPPSSSSLLTPLSSSSSTSSTTPLLPPLHTQWNGVYSKRKKHYEADNEKRNVSDVATEDMYFECEVVDQSILERTFHAMNVLPFGLRSPTEVFAMRGRHTNRGLIVNALPNGLFEVLPYDTVDREPLRISSNTFCEKGMNLSCGQMHASASEQMTSSTKQYDRECIVEAIRAKCCSSEVAEEISDFFRKEEEACENGSECNKNGTQHVIKNVIHSNSKTYENSSIEIWELRDLQLPTALRFPQSGECVSLVHAVNSRVLARRFGCRSTLHLATVLCAYYDLSYALQYDSDGAVDVGVLHSDTVRFSSTNAELYKVRDRVLVRLEKQLPALILDALGDEQYRIMLEQSEATSNKTNGEETLSSVPESVHVLSIGAKDILHLIPSFPEALHSPPYILHWFKQLDKSGRGHVCWKDVRQFMQSWETFSVPLSFQRVGELLREVCVHKRHVEPQLLRKMPMHDDEMQLCYDEFEYLILRAQNLM